jgi:hypothetical protein
VTKHPDPVVDLIRAHALAIAAKAPHYLTGPQLMLCRRIFTEKSPS